MKKNNQKNKKQRREKKLLVNQIRELNNHLPKKKKTLKDLIQEKNPTLETKNNEEITLKKEELKKIQNILPGHLHDKIKLPIYIESGKKYGKGNYRVQGKAETRLIQELLNKERDIFKKEIFINRIEVREIRNKLRSTTKYMFTVDLTDLKKGNRNEMGRTKRRRRS